MSNKTTKMLIRDYVEILSLLINFCSIRNEWIQVNYKIGFWAHKNDHLDRKA